MLELLSAILFSYYPFSCPRGTIIRHEEEKEAAALDILPAHGAQLLGMRKRRRQQHLIFCQ